MKESASAPVRPSVPWWERLAAGMLVAGWATEVLFIGGGLASWWLYRCRVAGEVIAIWERTLTSGRWEALVDPGSYDFAGVLCYGCSLFSEFAMGVLTAVALWLVVRGGSLRLRRLFWLGVVGYGLVKLGLLASSGRLVQVVTVPTSAWHVGWLDRFFSPSPRDQSAALLPGVIALLLGLSMLWLSRSRKPIDPAGGKAA